MNIFILDTDPEKSASMLHDKHVCKMPTESAQLLATCFTEARLAQADVPRTAAGTPWRHSHVNHPCALWMRQARANFIWLLMHAKEQVREYERRYGRRHGVADFIDWSGKAAGRSRAGRRQPFVQCVPELYRCRNAVEAYRNYYIHEKYHWYLKGVEHFNTWPSLDRVPKWFLAHFAKKQWSKFIRQRQVLLP